MSKLFAFALSVGCPRCHLPAGRWCRENGRAVPPHKERCQTALGICGSVFRPLKPSKDEKNEHKSFSSVPY